MGAEAPDGVGGLDDAAGVVAGQLPQGPPPQRLGHAGGQEAGGCVPAAARRRHHARDGQRQTEGTETGEAHAVVHAAAEVAAGGAQHQPLDAVTMAPPEQLGDRATHRVAGGEEAVDLEDIGQRGDVVGAVGEPEARGADSPAVAAVVEGDDPVTGA